MFIPNTFFNILISTFILSSSNVQSAFIDPSVYESLDNKNTINVIVSMKNGISDTLKNIQQESFESREDRINKLADELKKDADNKQSNVFDLLKREIYNEIEFESFWSSNSVFIKSASKQLINELSNLPEVEEIHEENIIELEPFIFEDDSLDTIVNGVEWGVDKVAAQDVWNKFNKGEGIIVANIDTGVRGTHEALVGNYIGAEKYGWYDPYENTAEPNDGNGHGTHTMGTIAGSNGVGVAPGAQWMACKGCGSRGCTERALLACGQFVLCPTDIEGNNKNCGFAPHISSNSWGGGQAKSWYRETTKAWRAAGIIPVFAQGNSGPRCGTANSPGDQEDVIGVGASTSMDSLASFSSVGPAKNGLMKPDVSAPGHQVKSAWISNDSSYRSISGTSMACPHTAGAIALMLSESKDLTYDEIFTALTSTCNTALKSTGKNCGGVRDDSVYPNHAYGHGVINVSKAVEYLKNGPPSDDPSTGTPSPTSSEPIECKYVQGGCVPADKCVWRWFKGCVPK